MNSAREPVQTLIQRAEVLAQLHRLDELAGILHEILSAQPTSAKALRLATWCAVERGHTHDGLEYSARLVAVEPDVTEHLRLRVRALCRAGLDARELAQAVHERPDALLSDSLKYLRICCEVSISHKNDIQRTRSLLHKACSAPPTDLGLRDAYELLRAALAFGEEPFIRSALALCTPRLCNESRTLAWAAYAAHRLGDDLQAMPLAQRAVQCGPNDAIGWQVLARVCHALGEDGQAHNAMHEYQRLRALKPSAKSQSSLTNGSGANSTIASSSTTSIL